ncbi:MAG TPA: fatty acid desaturase, partial [Burkholderiales bacterium]
AETKNRDTLEKFGRGTPDDWIERNVYARYSVAGIAIMMIVDFALFGFIGITIWAVQMLWIPFFAAGVINGIGHYWGYRTFQPEDASTNIVPWGVLIGGEELHNNHHAFATSAKLSNKWYELDIGWMYIRVLEMLGLAKVNRVAPVPRFTAPRLIPNLQTLQAVITHRYDVLAKYDQTLRRAERMRLADVLSKSRALHTVYSMRRELMALWERSTASKAELVSRLQDWCRRAEASGVRPLVEFSRRLRSYT